MTIEDVVSVAKALHEHRNVGLVTTGVRAEILHPDRTRNPELLEHPAAAGLAAQVCEPGVRAVHRETEADGDVPLERCGVVGDEVTSVQVGD